MARGLETRVDRAGYNVASRTTSVSLAVNDAGDRDWRTFANGVSRPTSFGRETIVVEPRRTEQFFTVEEPQGVRTWRWNVRSPGLRPKLATDGSVTFVSRNRLGDLLIAPVAIFDRSGKDVTPRALRWSLRPKGSSAWSLEARFDDTGLPLPYVIDPAITVRSASSAGNLGGSSLTLPKPTGVVSGDFLIAQVSVRGGATTTITPPPSPFTWTLLRRENAPTLAQAIYYRVAGGSEPISYTWTFGSSQNASGGIIAYVGVDTANPIDKSSGNNGNGTTLTALSVTTTVPDAMVVGFYGYARSTTLTKPADMTQEYQVQGGSGGAGTRTTSLGADVSQSTPGPTGDKVATAAMGPNDWVAHLVALKPKARSTSTVVDCPASTPANTPASCRVTVTDTDTAPRSPPQGTVDFEVTAQPAGSTPVVAPDPCTLAPDLSTPAGDDSFCTIEFSSTKVGSYTIKGTYQPAAIHATSNGSDTITVTPGPPAIFTLSPATAENEVDTEHCVTATVTDAFDNPNPGITVRFSVPTAVATHASPASGSDVTDANGQATFCYSASLPGEDAIHAFADTDGDGSQDAGEPFGDATKTWILPPSTAFCFVDFATYGVRIIALNGDLANAGGNAQVDGEGNPTGQHEYQDHGPADPINVHSINVLAVICTDIEGVPGGKQAQIYGRATIDGAGSYVYRVQVEDRGEPGTGNDKYWILLSNGYTSGYQTLVGGNVQIH